MEETRTGKKELLHPRRGDPKKPSAGHRQLVRSIVGDPLFMPTSTE